MYQINKTDTQLLKGIGILMIVFHNYLHLLPPYIGENEFNFDSNRFSRFWEAIIISPSSTWSHVLSFLGHYGISIFIFLTLSFSRKAQLRYKRLLCKKGIQIISGIYYCFGAFFDLCLFQQSPYWYRITYEARS